MARRRKRLTKKEIKEDKVADFLVEVGSYLRQNSRKVTGIAIVVLIGLLITTVAIRQRRAAEIDAQAWLSRANLDLKQGNVASALDSYSRIMERYRGTWSHSDAKFFSANGYYATGRFDSALTSFEQYLTLGKRRRIFTASAKVGIGQCLEQLGRHREAADNFLKAQREHPDSPLAPDALLGAARCYQLAGDLRQAESAYGDLIDLYPESSQAAIARISLLEIQARLENTS